MQNDTTMNRLVPRPTPRAAIAWPLRLAGVVAPWLGLAACGSARVKVVVASFMQPAAVAEVSLQLTKERDRES
jgi:hypothetical protein